MLDKKQAFAIREKLVNHFTDHTSPKFIDIILDNLSQNIILEKNIDELVDAITKTVNLSQTRPEDKINLLIDNHTDHSSIIIHYNNMPFLFDSIIEEFRKRDITVYSYIHSIFNAKRDKDGSLKDIEKFNIDQSSYISEAIVYLDISLMGDDEILLIKTKITDIIKVTRYSYDDWQIMRSKAFMIADKLADPSEERDFLEWLADDNYIFLAYSYITYENNKLTFHADEYLGILKDQKSAFENKITEDLEKKFLKISPDDLIVSDTANAISPVHRSTRMDEIIIIDQNESKDGKICAYYFAGIYSTTVDFQSIKNIPIIREKLYKTLQQTDFPETSFARREVVSILETLPRNQLLQVSYKNLYRFSLAAFELYNKPSLKLFYHKNLSGSIVHFIILLPVDRINASITSKITDVIVKKSNVNVSVDHSELDVADLWIARVYVNIHVIDSEKINVNVELLEEELNHVTCSKAEKMRSSLAKIYDKNQVSNLMRSYKDALPDKYYDIFPSGAIKYDIRNLEKLIESDQVVFNFYVDNNSVISLKIYQNTQIILSDIIPLLENIGFKTLDTSSFMINHKAHELWIYHFRLSLEHIDQFENIIPELTEALTNIWHGKMQNDRLNKLLTAAQLNWQEVRIIRTYTKYLRQTNFKFTENYIASILSKHGSIVRKIIQYFHCKFNPSLHDMTHADLIAQDIEKSLENVNISSEDSILRRFHQLCMATVRTSFYQHDSQGGEEHYPYLSMKFLSNLVPDLPLPLPYAEIFVYSTEVEAIHLRGGKIARGGMRWSDRLEDYRTEILGLMKAQMTKNTIIVPVGSKGGFVVKRPKVNESKEIAQQHIVRCYKTFLHGLLSITDNIIQNIVITPENLIKHDNDDPYLVVAADKGTASFSDYANQVAKEFNFWLGDAFASGGSKGYDHKKMAITSRGAWISVTRHFSEINKNIKQDEFTVVGIGDMSGDVFGNGMLMSDNICLVAAFNHNHIMIDPQPNSKTSYQERKRLFNIPGSNWNDYDRALLSPGGEIFTRYEKVLSLNPVVQKLLGISADKVTPDNLIQCLLKMNVDLIWNGGIGTYFKASTEINEQVGDKANDNLRINGSEIGAKIIGEGGNLGFTQLGRIEYAKQGGRINMDAIDNSAGVDCSDHEVNIKIFLNQLLLSQLLDYDTRDNLLHNMTDEVGMLVLEDNHAQTRVISIEEQYAKIHVEDHARLITKLEKSELLQRSVEFLPDKISLNKRIITQEGLTRPEIAVMLSYSKMALYDRVIETKIVEDPHCDSFLINYFPTLMQEKFGTQLLTHPLKKEIITTVIINKIINQTGLTFAHFTLDDTNITTEMFVRNAIFVEKIFNYDHIVALIQKLENNISAAECTILMHNLKNSYIANILWLNRHNIDIKILEKIISDNASIFYKNLQIISEYVKTDDEDITYQNIEKYIPSEEILALKYLLSFDHMLRIMVIANIFNKQIEQVTKLYFEVNDYFKINDVVNIINHTKTMNYWDRLSVQSLREQLHDVHYLMTISLIDKQYTISDWKKENLENDEIYASYIDELLNQENKNLSMMVIAVERIKQLCN